MTSNNFLQRMTEAVPRDASLALRLLEEAGFEAWIVGGWVRDQLLGLSPDDIDIATSATPAEIKHVFSKTASALVDQGARYGTIKVRLLEMACSFDQKGCENPEVTNSSSSASVSPSDRSNILSRRHLKRFSDKKFLDITTFRRDGLYGDNRHPKNVCYGQSIRDDLRRRDFTINAMAFHPDRGILDPFYGRKDIEHALIRTVGDARARIKEDALRILRAVRFSCAFNFQLEESLEKTVEKEAGRIASLSQERVGHELEKLVSTRWFSRALRQYKAVLSAAVPELARLDGYAQETPYHNLDILQHTARVIDYLQVFAGISEMPETYRIPAELGFAAVFHDIGKPAVMFLDPDSAAPETMHFYNHPAVSEYIANKIMKRLGVNRIVRQRASALIRFHDRPTKCTPLHVAQLLHGLQEHKAKDPYSLLYPLALLKEADAAAKAPQYRAGATAAEKTYVFEKELLRKNKRQGERSCTHPACVTPCQNPLPIKATELALNGDDIKRIFSIEPGPDISRIQEAFLKLIWAGAANNTQHDLSSVTRDAMLYANVERLKQLLFPNPDDYFWLDYDEMPGPKWPNEIGIELERFVMDEDTGNRLYYNTGIRDFFEAWLKEVPCSTKVIEDDLLLGVKGYLHGISYTLTLEPGAQFEISLGPTNSLTCLNKAFDAFDRDIKRVFSDIGLKVALVARGIDPNHTLSSDSPLLPKERYKAMDTYLARKGNLSREMMRESASTQISIDFLDHRRLSQELILSTVLSQYLYFLCDTTNSMARLDIWNNVDSDRCRIPRGLYLRKDVKLIANNDEEEPDRVAPLCLSLNEDAPEDKYLMWLLNTPCVYLKDPKQNDRFCNDRLGHRPLKEYFASKLLSDEELLWAASITFPDVRAKGYLEIRTADAMPPQYALALAAFIKGLFYNKMSFFNAYTLLVKGLEGSSPADIAPLLKEKGWNAEIGNQKLPDIVNLLLTYAEKGLLSPDNAERTPNRDSAAQEEVVLLKPLKELWLQKKTLNSLFDL